MVTETDRFPFVNIKANEEYLMTYIRQLELDEAEPKAQELLGGVQQQMGIVPNLFKVMAHSPAVLDAYLKQSGALSTASLPLKLREQIAVTIAGANGCDYCASAHTAIGVGAGVSEAELAINLSGASSDEKTQAALAFARAVVHGRGWIEESALQSVRDAGYSEGEIVEIIALVGLNTFTNYLNHIAGTEIDFPVVKAA